MTHQVFSRGLLGRRADCCGQGGQQSSAHNHSLDNWEDWERQVILLACESTHHSGLFPYSSTFLGPTLKENKQNGVATCILQLGKQAQNY